MKEEMLKKLKDRYNPIESDDKIKISMLLHDYLKEIKEEDTNKIYVYCGATIVTENDILIVNRENPNVTNLLYWNIEQPTMINIPIEKCKEFETNNTIVYGDYYKIMSNFFIEAIKTNQSEAVKKIIKKYKK